MGFVEIIGLSMDNLNDLIGGKHWEEIGESGKKRGRGKGKPNSLTVLAFRTAPMPNSDNFCGNQGNRSPKRQALFYMVGVYNVFVICLFQMLWIQNWMQCKGNFIFLWARFRAGMWTCKHLDIITKESLLGTLACNGDCCQIGLQPGLQYEIVLGT